MPGANWIRLSIALFAGLMLLVSTVTGDSIDESGLRWVGGISSAVTLLLLAIDRWIWRWPVVFKLTELLGGRVIHGTWCGELEFKEDGKGQPGKTDIYFAVEQTLSTVKIRCYFPSTRAESWSLTAKIDNESHRPVLRYIYQQQAEADERDTNRPTQGACELRLVGKPVHEIVGSYYAERGGKGKIRLVKYSRKVAGSADHASKLDYKIRAPKA